MTVAEVASCIRAMFVNDKTRATYALQEMPQNPALVLFVHWNSLVYLPFLFLEIIAKTIWNCIKPINLLHNPFTFILKHISCLPKKPQLLFQRTYLKSLLNRFPLLIKSYYVVVQSFFCTQLFLHLHFRVQFSQDPVFSGSRFFSVQVFLGPGPGFRSSHLTLHILVALTIELDYPERC